MKCGGFFVATHHEALLGDCTIPSEAQALSVTHARICLPHARNQERSIRKECGK